MRIGEEVTRMWGELTVNDWKAMKNEESGENTRRSYKNWGEVTRKLCESYEKWPESKRKWRKIDEIVTRSDQMMTVKFSTM